VKDGYSEEFDHDLCLGNQSPCNCKDLELQRPLKRTLTFFGSSNCSLTIISVLKKGGESWRRMVAVCLRKVPIPVIYFSSGSSE
jgi:hypothetical protein